MVGKDYVKFMKLIAGAGELYEIGYSPLLIEEYWQALKFYSFDIVKRAIIKIIKFKTDSSFITLSDIELMIKTTKRFSHVKAVGE